MSSKIKQRKNNRYKEYMEQEVSQQPEENGNEELTQANALDGGYADDLTIEDIAEMHNADLEEMKNQLKMGIKVEYEHTKDKSISTEIALDHLYEIPDYYTRLAKMEQEAKEEGVTKSPEEDVDEAMSAGGSGQFSAPMGKPIKREFSKLNNSKDYLSEAAPESSGQYDAQAFAVPKNNPLKIVGKKAIAKRAKNINKDKSFPKFGGPDAVFVKIKDKCKKFPYCNQDPDAIELMKEDKDIKYAINEVSKKRGIPYGELEKMVINEIKQIFI